MSLMIPILLTYLCYLGLLAFLTTMLLFFPVQQKLSYPGECIYRDLECLLNNLPY